MLSTDSGQKLAAAFLIVGFTSFVASCVTRPAPKTAPVEQSASSAAECSSPHASSIYAVWGGPPTEAEEAKSKPTEEEALEAKLRRERWEARRKEQAEREAYWDEWLSPPLADEPQPKFVCTERRVHAGERWPSEKLHFAWGITNAGEAPLRLKLYGGCIVRVGPAERIIAPGESQRIEYWIGGLGSQRGERTLSTTVESNDPENTKVKLEVEFEQRQAVAPDCRLDSPPSRRCYLGSLRRSGSPKTRTIAFERGDGGPLNPKVVGFMWPGPTAKLRTIELGERYEVDITMYPPWPERSTSNWILLETGVAEQPEARIGFHAYFSE
ncbi:MAG: hypothetical protein JSU63_11785 [Phycisphaerales bacterium]|nr:MAG: hypothetical protein JSU63_11785 [Phycisphaerales bacterium]